MAIRPSKQLGPKDDGRWEKIIIAFAAIETRGGIFLSPNRQFGESGSPTGKS
jgi:hypothetical protein